MKKIVATLGKAALTGIFIAFIACSGDETPLGKEEISASVSGVGTFTSSKDFDTVFGTKLVTGTAIILSIQGTDNIGKGILLRIATYDGPGTYELGVATSENLATWINGPTVGDQYSTLFQGTSGSIVVFDEGDGVVEGTFGFTAKLSDASATKTISNGKFKVNLR